MDDTKHTTLTAMLESIAEQDGLIHTLDWRVIKAALTKAGDVIQDYESRLDAARKAVRRGHYHHASDSYCFHSNEFAALMEALNNDH